MQDVTRHRDRPPDPYLDSLGLAMRQLRQRSGRTAIEVAERSELSSTEISGYETGKRRPGLDNLVRYLRGVEASLADLQRELDRLGDQAPLPHNGGAAPAEAEHPATPPGLDRLFERYLARALERLLDPDRQDAEARDRDSRAS